MNENRYVLAFTAGALLHQESLIVAQLMEELGDREAVRRRVMDDNLLQIRTPSASQRIFREIAERLERLTPAELTLVRTGTHQEQAHLLWLAVCKRYLFIRDFAVEVVREKFVRFDFALSYDAYDVFFSNKAEWHPEVDRVTESTRKKLRQVVFKMMREADLLTADNRILPAMLSPRAIDVIAADSPAYLMIFPISPTEIQEWLSR